ncbi:helix-turn-helix domain-containing protein [Chryseobacterium oranimense]|uniref:helix-turn-helix domain-containing protein n=1 Tax=Chryseobacterium oranimense TaxID=421058 RepID=UPI0021AF7979|nr:helix-turn-helix domain-containing protein [Chryseobacterium oranimense]UWX59487.1 helix-turn-helix domain-containing protein [Chryseobacterium oranimense]
MEKLAPDYKKIYTDIIFKKCPEKYKLCDFILQKKALSVLDVIKLNQLIFSFEGQEIAQFNQKHRSYDEASILEILEFQRKNGYNNTELADKFKLSRNSVAKWKKMFNRTSQSN